MTSQQPSALLRFHVPFEEPKEHLDELLRTCERIALREHLHSVYSHYAQLRPGLLFIDDDFKIGWGQCFHPRRVAQFAETYGCPVRYQRRDLGHEDWPFYYFVGRLPGNEYLPWRVEAPNATTLCHYLDEHGNPSAPHIVNWTSPHGARFGLINVSTCHLSMALLSPWSAATLVGAIEWVQGSPLPARTAESGNLMLKILRLNEGNELLLMLANLSTAPSGLVAIQPPVSASAKRKLSRRIATASINSPRGQL